MSAIIKSAGVQMLWRAVLFVAVLCGIMAVGAIFAPKAHASDVTCFRGDRVAQCEAGKSVRGKKHKRERYTAPPSRASYDANGNETVIGGRPSGCPWRFCGCEASLYKFGRIIPELNLAYNWIRKFPRTSPAPGMAAARSGHVMILISHVEGRDWLVHDGNSGGGKTRRHVRSIAGYVIVNPDISRHASLR